MIQGGQPQIALIQYQIIQRVGIKTVQHLPGNYVDSTEFVGNIKGHIENITGLIKH